MLEWEGVSTQGWERRRPEEGRRWKGEKGQPPWPGALLGGGGIYLHGRGVSLGGFEELCDIHGGWLLGCRRFGFNHNGASMEG